MVSRCIIYFYFIPNSKLNSHYLALLPIACQTRWKTFFPFLFNKTQTKNNCILNVINIRLWGKVCLIYIICRLIIQEFFVTVYSLYYVTQCVYSWMFNLFGGKLSQHILVESSIPTDNRAHVLRPLKLAVWRGNLRVSMLKC